MSRRIVVHSLADAHAAVKAAAALGVPVTLMSAPGAALYVGPLWFKALVREACAAAPEARVTAVLDCADAPGAVLAALRAGLKCVRFSGTGEVRERLAAIAAAEGASLDDDVPADLDLGDERDAEAACRAIFAAATGGTP